MRRTLTRPWIWWQAWRDRRSNKPDPKATILYHTETLIKETVNGSVHRTCEDFEGKYRKRAEEWKQRNDQLTRKTHSLIKMQKDRPEELGLEPQFHLARTPHYVIFALAKLP